MFIKKKTFVTISFAFLLMSCGLSEESVETLRPANADSISVEPVAMQVIINSHPQWGENGSELTEIEIVSRFNLALFSRNQMMDFLPLYQKNGYLGDAFVYLSGYGAAGPENLISVAAQSTPCTTTQRNTSVFSNSVTMDTGDFCEIHDAIIYNIPLIDYPDLVPVEDWFLHAPDGSRIFRGYAGDGAGYYVMNPAHLGWRTYFSRRAMREIQGDDLMHLPIAGVKGVFIDNLNSTFYLGEDFIPIEFNDLNEYRNAKLDLVKDVHKLLSGYGIPLMGNLSDMHDPSVWRLFMPYLDILEAETWITDWGLGLPGASQIESDLDIAESVLLNGKKFVGVVQGDRFGAYNKFAFACYLLITDGKNAFYRYKNYHGDFSEYYEIPEYDYRLGAPVGPRKKISEFPVIYERDFKCGKVVVNLTDGSAEIKNAECLID